MESDFPHELRSALQLDVPYPERPPNLSGTPASVLVLIGDVETEPSILVTRRTEQVESHKGQMAFPGGMRERGESDLEAALRETEEEVGILRDRVDVVGELPKLWTVTGFWVTPVVGLLRTPIGETRIAINAGEIAETLWVPIRTLQSSEIYKQEWIERGSIRFPIHCYYVGPHRIWGATGAMIQNLLTRLQAANQ